MSAILIRRAAEDDLPAIHALVRELAVYEEAEEEFTASLESYVADFSQGVFEALVAEKNGRIIGMGLYYLTFSTWKGKMLFLEDFVVEEGERRQGVGQKLFEGIRERAVELGCRLIKWQVLDWNTPAVRFYEKNGAVIEKDWWNGKLFLSP